jgi:adenylate cyclase
MPVEVERKFLVRNDSWKRPSLSGTPFRQGYPFAEKHRSVRIRIEGNAAFLTLKSPLSGISRREYQYEVPLKDAEEILEAFCDLPAVEKIRYRIEHGGHSWEIDEFQGDNEGLVIAEVNLQSEDEPFDLPGWAGTEVTKDEKYLNASLYLKPFRTWE